MDPILTIARRHNLVVIEDSAQAHAAEYNGRRCGSIGDLGCFSFYPGKNLGAYGEGGLVTTNNPDFARKIRMLRDWGAEKKYEHVLKGFNYRMEAIQGAILRVKLKYLEQWTNARRAHAAAYAEVLSDSGLTLPTQTPGGKHVYHVYAVLTNQRRELIESLELARCSDGNPLSFPNTSLPAYADLGYKSGDFPVSERVAAQGALAAHVSGNDRCSHRSCWPSYIRIQRHYADFGAPCVCGSRILNLKPAFFFVPSWSPIQLNDNHLDVIFTSRSSTRETKTCLCHITE